MIKFINELTDEPVGGKAMGLKILRDLGLNVPDAFVIIHPTPGNLNETLLKKQLEKLGVGPKAVRSSAVSEDGYSASFAGQFDTFLDLRSYPEIKDAIFSCIKGANGDRVKDYASNIIKDADLRISVILQNMVDARFAGVVFSANPVSNRRDKVLINAVEGTGDHLVSGVKDGIQYEIFRSGSDIAAQINKVPSFLTEKHLEEILVGAKKAEQHYGFPVDLEWAIDHQDHLHWLQVRPITTLQEVHLNELDTVQGVSRDVWTLGNIGEMMPGVVTPLTYSVSAEAIDYGMTMLADQGGAFPLEKRNGKRYIQMFYNRLFINMSNMMDYPKNIWLNKPEDVQFALSGKIFPGITAKPEGWLLLRMINFARQMISTNRAGKHVRALKSLDAGFRVDVFGDLRQIHKNLGIARDKLGIGFGHHLIASAQSGSLYSAFMRIMTGDKRIPTAEDHHNATMLFLDIPEIESADAVKSLERFAALIKRDRQFSVRFIASSTQDALRMLMEDAPAEIRAQFSIFLERHGHRCVRESELREKPWEENPERLIHTLQTQVRIGDVKHPKHNVKKETHDALGHLPLIKRNILKSLVPTARKAVARREITKALSIRMVNTVRKGYQVLAKRLCLAGLLDDPDQVYFLTHEEIGMLISDRSSDWKSKADRRRALLAESDKLVFEEVSFGTPEPIEQETHLEIKEGQLRGTPVSNGIIKGNARIVHTLADADELQQGEIMVASFTDVGWTPYFSIISGLVTEIGSPLSHGAVVAREYGIPAVVGAKGAKLFLQTGDLILLDGDKGIISKCEAES